MARVCSEGLPTARSIENLAADISAVQAIAQAAINVELFTIPLYQTALYSLEGMHAVTDAGNDLYKGRKWPGMKTSADADNANKVAFNVVFSVFIQEMLHLQLAANMATAIGVKPTFTSPLLQSEGGAWLCYGPDKTTIPHIVDLTQTKDFKDVKVMTGALDKNSVELFIAIEQPEEQARRQLEGHEKDYFPKVPFKDWTADKTEVDLPMFGTIGWMYQCYHDYLHIKYDDGKTLWDHVYNPTGVQNDLFNNFSSGHPMREFPGFETTVALTYSDIAFKQVLKMMDAITDQGEGATLKPGAAEGVLRSVDLSKDSAALKDVRVRYRPSRTALESDYPSYSDTGALLPSADAAARANADGYDHYERFIFVYELLGKITTWAQSEKPGHWTERDLQPDPEINTPYDIPPAADVARALNNLNNADAETRKKNFDDLSLAVVGCIRGVTTVLNDYWNPPANGTAPGFPFPSMSGTGPRVALCWAVFGQGPDLSLDIPKVTQSVEHACQGLDTLADAATVAANACANPAVYHNCRGSNACAGQGGCGYVQPVGSSGGGCGASVAKTTLAGSNGCHGVSATATAPSSACRGVTASAGTVLCNTPTPSKLYNAPSDNYCGGMGGCAAPMSASQLFPQGGTMNVYSFTPQPHGCGSSIKKQIGTVEFANGQRVDDVAYQAFKMVMQSKGIENVPDQPKPNDLRLAFPPTT